MPIGLADRIAGYVNEAYRSIPRRGAESGGLLLGGVRLGPVIDIFITGFEPVACDYCSGPSFVVSDAVREEFRSAISRHSAAEVVGYYRSHTRPGPGLENSDQELVDRIFPGLSGLVLVIRPSGMSKLTGGYYFFQNGRLETRPVGPEFPFLVSVPGGVPPPTVAGPAEPPTPEPPAKPAREPAARKERETEFRKVMQESLEFDPPSSAERAAPVPPPADYREPARRRRKLQWEIVASGLMIAAALALLWWQYRGSSGEGDSAITQSVPSRVAALGLTVHPGEGGWRITWDPTTTAVRDSVRGALQVTEDESHERIPLSPEQVRAGVATYRPIGEDITFRLDLVEQDNSLSTETYRVILKPREPETAATPRPARKQAEAPKAEPKVAEAAPKADQPEPKPEEGHYVESEVLTRVSPEVPDGIRPRITQPLPIDVRVSIDREGRVTGASAVQHRDGLIDYLGKRAVAAARQWTFTPARRGGKPVDSTRTIHFVFEQ